MKRATMVITAVLIAVLLGTGIGKIKRVKPIRNNMRRVEMPRRWYNRLASLELLGATGLLVGLLFPPLGIVTALCLVLYFGGAVLAHVRTKDVNVLPSGLSMILSGVLAARLWEEDRNYKAPLSPRRPDHR